MTEFERTLVNSFNDHFKKANTRALAYRLKQHRFTAQFLDVLDYSFILRDVNKI